MEFFIWVCFCTLIIGSIAATIAGFRISLGVGFLWGFSAFGVTGLIGTGIYHGFHDSSPYTLERSEWVCTNQVSAEKQ